MNDIFPFSFSSFIYFKISKDDFLFVFISFSSINDIKSDKTSFLIVGSIFIKSLILEYINLIISLKETIILFFNVFYLSLLYKCSNLLF